VKSKLLSGSALQRSYALVFAVDDDVLPQLREFLVREALASAKLYGIGGFRRAGLGYYDVREKRYLPIEIDEQVEVLSFIGNVARYAGQPRLHAHCVLGHRDGRTTGGHLLAAIVRPTLELMVEELGVELQRVDDPEFGIPLLS
jgi:uncharacterized protein